MSSAPGAPAATVPGSGGMSDKPVGAPSVPAGRTPNGADWTRISTGLRARIDAQIAALQRTRELLGDCIGCGCLSLKKCGLYNRDDKAAQRGAGPRYVLGDRAKEIAEIG